MKKIQQKTLLVIASSAFLFLVFLFLLVKPILLAPYLELEQNTLKRNSIRVQNNVYSEIDNLASLNRDWAVWDDTYFFLLGESENYIQRNLADETFINNKLSFMIFTDLKKDIIFQKGFDYRNNMEQPITNESIETYLQVDVNHTKFNEKGIVTTSQGVALLSINSVLPSNGKGSPVGYLIMGRYLDDHYIQEKSQELALPLRLAPVHSEVVEKTDVEIIDEDKIKGNVYLETIDEENTYSLSFTVGRQIVQQGKESVHAFFVYQLFGIFVVTILIVFLLNKFILSRISNLAYSLQKIGKEKSLSGRVTVIGKDELSILEKKVNLMLESIEESQIELTKMAYCDSLTNLYNRPYLYKKLDELVTTNHRLAVLFLDLDGFKPINDSLGHFTGDVILKEISMRLKEHLPSSQMISRLGGDEFVIILEDISDVKGTCKEILQLLAQSFVVKGLTVQITGSIGISFYPEDGKTPEELVQKADIAMYEAKRNGKNKFYFFHELNEDSYYKTFVSLERDLRHAIDNEELELYYQPIVKSDDKKVIGAEALLRWHHPDKGLISPLTFIPIAEEIGIMNSIGEWVLKTSFEQVKEWHNAGYTDFMLSINLSKTQMLDDTFITIVDNALKQFQLSSHLIEFEITESVVGKFHQEVINFTKQLRDRKLRVALDDFGTGESSLIYLKELKVDTIKIDRNFIKQIPMDKFDTGLLNSIIFMCENLNIDIVCEGIETKQQFEFLRQRGQFKLQGYLFSMPVPKDEFEKLLHEAHKRLEEILYLGEEQNKT